MGSGLQTEKIKSPEEPHATATVAGDSRMEQDDVWEELDGVDVEVDWKNFESDYYSSEDDATIEESTENGDWLSIGHKHSSRKQSPLASLGEEEEKLELSSNGTNVLAQNQPRKRERSPDSLLAPAPFVQKSGKYWPRRYRSGSARELKSQPCEPIHSTPATELWKILSEGEMETQNAKISGFPDHVGNKDMKEHIVVESCEPRPQEKRPSAEALAELKPSTHDSKSVADERSSTNCLTVKKTKVTNIKITRAAGRYPSGG
ncbi:hypothetical protein ANO14919_051010 [Xylariales sp. No.14919]|nr:hypothetical protein ANO14919_051010 [Xylariales sp. No.14919]